MTLSLDDEGKVKYHKYMWNEKDYSHEGLGKVFETLNGDHLTKITQPPGKWVMAKRVLRSDRLYLLGYRIMILLAEYPQRIKDESPSCPYI